MPEELLAYIRAYQAGTISPREFEEMMLVVERNQAAQDAALGDLQTQAFNLRLAGREEEARQLEALASMPEERPGTLRGTPTPSPITHGYGDAVQPGPGSFQEPPDPRRPLYTPPPRFLSYGDPSQAARVSAGAPRAQPTPPVVPRADAGAAPGNPTRQVPRYLPGDVVHLPVEPSPPQPARSMPEITQGTVVHLPVEPPPRKIRKPGDR